MSLSKKYVHSVSNVYSTTPFLTITFQMWPNPILSAASAEVSNITGPTGVKMSGPYAWTSPYYWYVGDVYISFIFQLECPIIVVCMTSAYR